MPENDYKLYGMLMSPYSMKMRAYLRYRRIAFQWCNDMRAQKVAETKVRTYMVPVIEYPDGTFENDSTPIINKLKEIQSGRALVCRGPYDCLKQGVIRYLPCLYE